MNPSTNPSTNPSVQRIPILPAVPQTPPQESATFVRLDTATLAQARLLQTLLQQKQVEMAALTRDFERTIAEGAGVDLTHADEAWELDLEHGLLVKQPSAPEPSPEPSPASFSSSQRADGVPAVPVVTPVV